MSVDENRVKELQNYDIAFRAGYVQALRDYAVWHDGVQTVDCGMKTLAQAIEDFEKGRDN